MVFMRRSQSNSLGLYVSIPFCRSKCTYCNFASGVYPVADHARYVERLVEDLVCRRPMGGTDGRGTSANR